MASKKRGPGAGNTGASRKNVSFHSDSNNSHKRRGVKQKERRPVDSHAGARRAYAVYDGRTRLGTFIWNEKTQQALAWSATRRFIGRFGAFIAAARAIGAAAASEQQLGEPKQRAS
jgi:hypothetical protein